MGRAARNLHGTAILYADRMTGSMERALEETSRRRKRQHAYNKEHGIEPESIRKRVTDIMEGAYPTPHADKGGVAGEMAQYASLSPVQLLKKAAKLEKQMLRHARDLEFEEAARLRDEIQQMRDHELGLEQAGAGS